MKEKIKVPILICLIIVLIISIVSLTILFIFKNNNSTNNNNTNNINKDNNTESELYNAWGIYKTEIVKDNEVLYDMEISGTYFYINDNNFINICYQANGEIKCNSGNYVFNNNKLNIIGDDLTYSGIYKVTFNEDTMILEKTEDKDTNTLIKHYFQRPLG